MLLLWLKEWASHTHTHTHTHRERERETRGGRKDIALFTFPFVAQQNLCAVLWSMLENNIWKYIGREHAVQLINVIDTPPPPHPLHP